MNGLIALLLRIALLLASAVVLSCGRAPAAPATPVARAPVAASSVVRSVPERTPSGSSGSTALPSVDDDVGPAEPEPPSPVTVFNDHASLPASIRKAVAPSFFAKRSLVRLEVGVGCAARCGTYAWPEYAARCGDQRGVEHAPLSFKSLAHVSVWPDGYKPKPNEYPGFSWHVFYDGAGFDVPPHFCKPVVYDTYWFDVPKTTATLTARSSSYGSDLCMCLD